MRGWKIFGWVMTIVAFCAAALNLASFVIIHSVLADFGQELTASFGYFGSELLSAIEIDTRLVFVTLLGGLAVAAFELAIGTLIVMRRWR
jgi:hypothetical protein